MGVNFKENNSSRTVYKNFNIIYDNRFNVTKIKILIFV